MLTVNEVAALCSLSQRHIRRLAQGGKLPCEMSKTPNGRPQYLFPLSGLSALDPDLTKKYLKQKQPKGSPGGKKRQPSDGSVPRQPEPLEAFSEEERGEIAFWTKIVREWQAFRTSMPEASAETADTAYIALLRARYPDLAVSRSILYARKRAVEAEDYRSLTDGRGKARRGYSKIDPDLWQAFLYYYLDEAQHPIRRCYEFTALWAEQYAPQLLPLPEYTTFYRHAKNDLPIAVTVLGREGEKAFKDRCAPYIRRIYDDMASNEWWIADNHTFDVITQGPGGQRHRLYLTAFFDARSGIFTGCYVTDAPSSQSTLIALRRGILKYGIPENIYVDNGREFLTHDVGGLGHRTKGKADKDAFTPPPVFERLGIHMTNAIVRNAKAKVIERRFRDVKDQLSRLFDSFCGGNVLEKPERLKQVIKEGHVVLDGDFTRAVETLLEGWFNEAAYGGAVTADHGKPRIQVWSEHLYKQRLPQTPQDLNLMLMRSSRPITVGRNGVTAKLYGMPIDYGTDEFTFQWQGKQVYYRYDPDDLRTIRAYDPEDRFIAELPARSDLILKYGASREGVAEAMRNIRSYERMVKDAKAQQTAHLMQTYGKHSALELALANAEQKISARIVPGEAAHPQLIELVSAEEQPLLKVAGDEDPIDFTRLNANSIKNNGGINDDV